MPNAFVDPRSNVRWQYLCAGLVGVVVAATSGCSSKNNEGITNQVSGTLTVSKTPVNGGATVTFIGSDGKKASGQVTATGEYVIPNPPLGKVQITVAGLGGGPGPGMPAPAPSATGAGAPTTTTANIPAKYAKPDNGLTYEVKGGKESFNIDLTP